MGQLRELVEELVKKIPAFVKNRDSLLEFVGELGEGELSVERAIYWYTCDEKIYWLTNNLLRSGLHPA